MVRCILIERLLKETVMESSNPVKGLIVGVVYDENDDGSLLKELMNGNYPSIVGSSLKLSIGTCPNLCVAASMLGAHVEQSNEKDGIVAKKAKRYLNDTKDITLVLAPGNGISTRCIRGLQLGFSI